MSLLEDRADHPRIHLCPPRIDLVTRLLVCLVTAQCLVWLGAGPAHAQHGVSDDRVSLPGGPGSLEGVGENVAVAANMGLMQYQVPIEVPAGFAGVTPELALGYSSGNGSTSAGIGWDLPLPTIERMTWKGLPEYTTDDLFAADGSEQLALVGIESGERVYRARFEKSFVRYRWLSSGDGRGGYWIAEYPDGRIGYFGADRNGVEVDSARVTGSDGQVFRYHLVEVVDVFGHRLHYRYRIWGNVALVDRIEYVHSGNGQPRYAVQFGYEQRQDVISDAGAGFETVMTQRLASIDVLSLATRMRRYLLEYEPYEQSGGLSRLSGVAQLGYLDEPYPIHFRFGYSRALGGVCSGKDCATPFVVDMGTLPGGVDMATGDATLVDINGDALPDVLDTSRPGAHRFYRNVLESEGVSRFAPAITESAVGVQSSHRLSAANVQVLDVNGDGFSDLINSFTGVVLCNDASGDWSPAGTGPSGSPCLGNGSGDLQLVDDEPGDPNPRHVRFIDIDNDKRIDVLRTASFSSTQIYRNTSQGFVAMANAQPLGWVFDEDQLQLADMNGDGLLDVVQIDLAGGIHYRLNLGLGTWSSVVDVNGIALSSNEVALAQIEDINGDGLADVVVVVANQLRYALNRNAGRFDGFVTVTSAAVQGDLPERTATTTVVMADMNGSGTQDIVWISNVGRVRYLELFPIRPNLLSRIENGIGSVQVIEYGTSVAHQARDRDAGDPAWKYTLPHPMNVVDRTDTWVTLTGGEDGQGLHEIVEYRYHHGYYDSTEKRFRGFERAESDLISDASQEPGRTVSEFDVGAGDVYYNGLLRVQSVVGLGDQGDVRPIREQRTDFGECEVAGAPGAGLAYPVRSICMVGQTTILQEGAASQEWATTRTEYEYDGYGNATRVKNLGVVHRGPPEAPQSCGPCDRDNTVFGEACGATCQGDEEFSETDYIEPGSQTGDRWITGGAFRERSYGAVGGDVTETTTFYDGPAFVGLPAGQLSQGLVTRTLARVHAGSDETISLTRNRHDSHGNVVEMIDPNGSLGNATSHRRVREYDSYGLQLQRTEILLEDDSGGTYRLRQELGYEPLFSKVSESTALMRVGGGTVQSARNSTFYRYDAFGRLHKVIRPGDSDDAPSQEYVYELADPASRIVMRQRSVAGGDADMETVGCVDGSGRTFQTRARLASGSYQVAGFTEYNRRGAAVRVYEPYLDSSSACAAQAPGAEVLSSRIRYDALSRQIEVILPDGAISGQGQPSVQRTMFTPLATLDYDPEDSDPASPHHDTPVVQRTDGLGRVVAIERHLQAMGTGAEAPTITIHYDSLGRMRGYRDPAGHIKTQGYDLLGRVITVEDPNAGTTIYEYDAAGNPVMIRDGRGSVTRASYDGANRLTARWDEADPDGSRVSMRYDMAESCPARRCTNVEGKLAEVLYPVDFGDGATVGRDQFGFDVRGRGIYQARVMLGHELATEHAFDNADRLVRTVYPDGQELVYSYDGASRLTGIDGILDQVTYDGRGQPAHIQYHNGSATSFSYDPLHRLAELTTTSRDSRVLQGFAYRRDRNGNILSIEDLAEMREGHVDADSVFRYDSWYRLLGADLGSGLASGEPETLDYQYDVIDRIVQATSSRGSLSPAHIGDYTYDPARPNGVVQAGSMQQTLDGAGYVVERDGRELHWDHAGRLTGVTRGTDDAVARFAYGGNQERVAKREANSLIYYISPDFEVRDGIGVLYARMGSERVARLQSDTLATVLLSDLAPLSGAGVSAPDGEINAADAWIAHAAENGLIDLTDSGGGAGTATHSDPAALLRSSARRLLMEADAGPVYLHGDHLGSLTLATGKDGEVRGERGYYPFGDVRAESGYVDSHGFTGQERDDSTGLLQFQHRYLDTGTGRWLSPDPLFSVASSSLIGKLGDSTTAYAYVSGNVTNAIDKTGLDTYVIYVHGTFSRGAGRPPAGYARPGGYVDRELTPRGGHYEAFGWNGWPFQRSRENGGRVLAERLNVLLRDGHTVELVGHSHGGNIIGHALGRLEQGRTVQSVTLLGTPHGVGAWPRGYSAWTQDRVDRVEQGVLNVYSNKDRVQWLFGKQRLRLGGVRNHLLRGKGHSALRKSAALRAIRGR